MQISRVNFEDQRIARKSLRKPENGLLFRHCCCTQSCTVVKVGLVVVSLLVALCVGVCEICIWQQHEMGWNFCRLLLPLPQPLLPSSSGLLHILLMQYFAFRFCVLSILLHARNILRSLRSCHCSIIIVCPGCAMPGPSSDTFAARFGHRVDRITTTRWPCSRCSSSCRCWCWYSPTLASPLPCGASVHQARQRTRATNAWRAPSAR